MKQQFTGTYTFTPSTGLVSLSGIDLPLERLYLIVNTTRNVPIFNFAVSGLGATRSASSGNTIFDLAFDTSSHNSSDKLTIIYEDGFTEPGVQIGELLGVVMAADQNGSGSITLSSFSGWVAMAKLNNNGNPGRSVQVEISSSSTFGVSGTTALSILFKGNTYTSFNNSQIPPYSPDYGFFYLHPGSLRYLRVKGLEAGGTTECAFYKANLDQAPRGTPLTDTQLRNSPVPVSGAHGAINTSSVELTTSNSVEVLAASSAATPRRYLFLQNLSTAPIYVNFTNAATATSMRLDAGSSLSFEGNFVPSNSVHLLRSTTSNQRYFLMHATY